MNCNFVSALDHGERQRLVAQLSLAIRELALIEEATTPRSTTQLLN